MQHSPRGGEIQTDLLIPSDAASFTPVALKTTLERLNRGWSAATPQDLGRAFESNARALSALLRKRPLLPRGVLLSVMQSVASLTRLVPKAYQRLPAADLVLEVAAAADAVKASDQPSRDATFAAFWIVARNVARSADASMLENVALVNWLVCVVDDVVTSAINSSSSHGPDRRPTFALQRSGRLDVMLELLERHSRAQGQYASVELADAVCSLARVSIDDDLAASSVERCAAILQSKSRSAPTSTHASPPPVKRGTSSEGSPQSTGGSPGSAHHSTNVPHEGDVFTYTQVRDFMDRETERLRGRMSVMKTMLDGEKATVAQLKAQLAEARAALEAVSKPPSSTD